MQTWLPNRWNDLRENNFFRHGLHGLTRFLVVCKHQLYPCNLYNPCLNYRKTYPFSAQNQEKMHFFENFFPKCLQVQKKAVPLHRFWNERHRAFSSAGSEHLPYKQRVGGSNPSTPTSFDEVSWIEKVFRAFSSAGSEHLPYKQRVGGSNPSTPTEILKTFTSFRAFSSAGSEHLPYKQRVGGSNPSTPTEKLTSRSGAVGSSLGS